MRHRLPDLSMNFRLRCLLLLITLGAAAPGYAQVQGPAETVDAFQIGRAHV